MVSLCAAWGRKACCWLAAWGLGAVFVSAQTNAEVSADSTRDLTRKAMAYERAGERLKAAGVYEELIRLDATLRPVLAQRLVRLYAEARQAEKALTWAQVVMEQNPDPQAYLAGVRGLLGNYAEAKRILTSQVASAQTPTRKLTLLFQLADVWQQEGNPVEAERTLLAASQAAEHTPDEDTATRMLGTFYDKQGDWAKATALYQTMASKADGPRRDHYLQRAAEMKRKSQNPAAQQP